MTRLEAGRHRTAIAAPALTLILGALAPSSAAQCELEKLLPAEVDVADELGNAVAIDEDTLLVGAHLRTEAGISSGGAYVFVRSGAAWAQQAKLLPHDGETWDLFGDAVATDGDISAVGARWNDDQGSNCGSAYVFSAGPPMEYGTAKVNSQACTPSIAAFGLASLSDPGPFHITATDVINNKNGQLIYGLNGRAAMPFHGGTLLVAAPIQRTPVRVSGGNPPPDDCSGSYSFDFNAWAQAARSQPRSGCLRGRAVLVPRPRRSDRLRVDGRHRVHAVPVTLHGDRRTGVTIRPTPDERAAPRRLGRSS